VLDMSIIWKYILQWNLFNKVIHLHKQAYLSPWVIRERILRMVAYDHISLVILAQRNISNIYIVFYDAFHYRTSLWFLMKLERGILNEKLLRQGMLLFKPPKIPILQYFLVLILIYSFIFYHPFIDKDMHTS